MNSVKSFNCEDLHNEQIRESLFRVDENLNKGSILSKHNFIKALILELKEQELRNN